VYSGDDASEPDSSLDDASDAVSTATDAEPVTSADASPTSIHDSRAAAQEDSWQSPAERTVPDKPFEVASRRRPVVFEEDDDLDVPDFLK
jgi:cell division protein FtsZ